MIPRIGGKTRKELAGHQDIGTTQRSMHLSPAAIKRAIQLLAQPALTSARGDIVETGIVASREESNLQPADQEWQTTGHLIGTLRHEPRQSVAVSFGPLRVVPAHAGDHSFGRRRKPAAEVLIQVTEPLGEVLIGAAAEMNVRRLSTHQPQ
jgi:hypothetical protein